MRIALTPVSSAGVVSGVNWMRLKVAPSMCAVARASSVFALPGGPSSSTCPRASAATSSSSTARSCPMTTFAISAFARSRRSMRLSYGASTMQCHDRSLPVLPLVGRKLSAALSEAPTRLPSRASFPLSDAPLPSASQPRAAVRGRRVRGVDPSSERARRRRHSRRHRRHRVQQHRVDVRAAARRRCGGGARTAPSRGRPRS